MGKVYETIDAPLARWIERQKLFFVATAPAGAVGHVNCSPKGIDTLRITGPRCLAYLDLTGSGAETIAHVRENARILIMLCAFEGPPKIVRLHGHGRVVVPGDEAFDALATNFPAFRNTRSIIDVDVSRISDSCGYGVPLYDYRGERDSFSNWTAARTDEEIAEYQRTRNGFSIDGLPALSRD